jgi:acyl dehydratase
MSARYSELSMGERFELAVEPVTTIQLVKYAGASDDYNRIHYDQAYAMDAGLGGVIAHGMLTMGFMGRAVTGWAGPQARIKHIAARFTSLVRPGDSVRITGTVESKDTRDNVTCIACKIVATVGDKTVASGEATVQWYPAR